MAQKTTAFLTRFTTKVCHASQTRASGSKAYKTILRDNVSHANIKSPLDEIIASQSIVNHNIKLNKNK